MNRIAIRSLAAFFGLTSLLSWGLWIPMIFLGREIPVLWTGGTFGPLAVIMTGIGADTPAGALIVGMGVLIFDMAIFSPTVKTGDKQ